MAILKVKDKDGSWSDIDAIVGPRGPAGPDGPAGAPGAPGANATINGVNALTIQGGDGINATMNGNELTIKVKTVEEWIFTLEDDSTVTKKVVLV